MCNWIVYIDSKFSAYDSLNSHENKNAFYSSRLYKINGVYISFEFDGVEKISKVECGNYFFENNFEYVSSVKAVLDKTQKSFLRFLQISYDGENGEQYELNYNNDNKYILDTFLKLPIEDGWTENLYTYKGGAYKVNIQLNDIGKTSSEVILLSLGEQDFPMPGDKINRKIDAFFIDVFYRKKSISVKKTIIKPFLTVG